MWVVPYHRETSRSFQIQYLQKKEKEAGRYFIYTKAWLHLFKRSSNERKHKQSTSFLSKYSPSYTEMNIPYFTHSKMHKTRDNVLHRIIEWL